MATNSSLLHFPELHFLSPQITHNRRFSFSTRSISRLSTPNVVLRATRIRAAKDESALAERVNDVELNGNGVASRSGINGTASGYVNGAVNRSSVEYGYGNGNGVAVTEVVDVEASKVNEDGRKRRLEEIGKEDAWFKETDKEKVEVAVAPGGRWSRFKTYSTIQRTLEIWGFVVTFVFKAWLDNQKFSYKGGMTEEKKKSRRKTLAKWLKESILRLGPTFIKIGQQFSTRVDILPQEYVDQLSELQDQVPPFPSETALAIVEEELGASVGDIFDQFDYEPIAAASL
ncbi:ABC transporter-like protein, partial [Trifolium pratense]